MHAKLIPVFLPLLLLNDYSCDCTESLSKGGVVQEVEDDTERSGEMCVGPDKRDIIIFTRGLFTQLCT